MVDIFDIREAEKYRLGLRDKVKKKKREFGHSSDIKDTQKILFKEFIQKERTSTAYVLAKETLKFKYANEKEQGPLNYKQYFMNDIKKFINKFDNVENGYYMDLAKHMYEIEKKAYVFEEEDFKEITRYMLSALEKKLSPIKDILASWKIDSFDTDREKFYRHSMNPNFGQNVMSLLNKPGIDPTITSLSQFLICTLHEERENKFACDKEDRNEIFNTHVGKFKELLAITGNLELFERFKELKSSSEDYLGYENLKKLSILKGDLQTFFSIHQSRKASDTTARDLKALGINKEREEGKEKLIGEIRSAIFEINRLAGEKLFNEDDYYSHKEHHGYGKKGRELMKLYRHQIREEHDKIHNILAELKKKAKEEEQVEQRKGVATVIATLLNKGEPKTKSEEKIESRSKKAKKPTTK